MFQLHLRWRLGELETRKGIADFLVTPPHIQPTWENKQDALIVEMKSSAAKRKPNFIGADKTESEEDEEEEEEEEEDEDEDEEEEEEEEEESEWEEEEEG